VVTLFWVRLYLFTLNRTMTSTQPFSPLALTINNFVHFMRSLRPSMSEEHLWGQYMSVCLILETTRSESPLFEPIVVQQWDPRVPTVTQQSPAITSVHK
jgi:hypothetical protein